MKQLETLSRAEITPLFISIQESIKLAAFAVISLLSFRGLVDFFEGSRDSTLRGGIEAITNPLVAPFYDIFPRGSYAVDLAVFGSIAAIVFVACSLILIAGFMHKITDYRIKKLHMTITTTNLKAKRTA
jgi:hypothetical protein